MKMLLLAMCLLVPAALRAQDDAELKEMDSDIKQMDKEPAPDDPRAMMRAEAEDARRLSDQMREEYQGYVKALSAQRERLRNQVLGKWDSFDESTSKKWVDYSKDSSAKSQVDFEKGKVTVEVLVPVEDVTGGVQKKSVSELNADERKRLDALAEKKLAEQAEKAIAQKDSKNDEVLKDQIADERGQPVTPETAPRFVLESLAPKMQVEDKPVVAHDGKPRLKVKVQVPLVPEHLMIRAKRYQPQVDAAADRYGLEPALIFAVIQAESEFNPMARSGAPAFGLMQLMPKTAALEAYHYLHGKDKLLSPDELYDADTNILLGSTYLHMLEVQHFGKVKDADNRRSLAIAAYNCGPGCVRKDVMSKGDVDAMANDELVSLIRRAAPRETAEYVPRVQGRMPAYEGLESKR